MKTLDEFIKEALSDVKTYVNWICLTSDEEYALILRRDNYMKKFPSQWGFPGGSVDEKDKNDLSAATRELEEETGIKLTWNEEHNTKLFEKITNKDGSISLYYKTTLETTPEVKLSKEHSEYEWFSYHKDKTKDWMPDVFHLLQKILD